MAPTAAGLAVDALLLGAVAVCALVGPALLVARRRALSAHLRRRVLEASILAVVATFALSMTAAPGPVGCLASTCGVERVQTEAASTAFLAATAAAAGKFGDLAPAGAAIPAPRGRPVRAGVVSLVLLLWLVGVAFALARIVRRRWLAFRIVRTARPVRDAVLRARFREVARRLGVSVRVRLLHHPDIATPVVAGAFQAALLLPTGAHGEPELERADADLVFLHELSHVRMHDPAATLACELVAALFWFHPLVLAAARRLRELQEHSADSDVLRGGVKPSIYASYLLQAVRRFAARRGQALADQHPIAGDCIMEARLRTVLDPTARHEPLRAPTVAAITALALAIGVAFAVAPLALQAGGLIAQDAHPPSGMRTELLRPAALDSLLRPVIIDHMADRYIAGSAVAVVHDGEVVYRAGFGRREVFSEDPVDVDRTIWRIGSITKVLTGLAVLQLVDEGRVDLDRDVNEYFERPIVPEDRPQPVLVRHLLTHTAGFDQVGLGRQVDRPEAVRPLEDFLREYLARVRDPGVLSTYDTYGITLAGLLVEEVSGLPYEEYLRRRIFEPLEMHRSGIAVPPALAGDVAVGYSFAGHWEAERWEYMNTDPASTVNASAPDMANLAIMLLNEGSFRGERVLHERSARAMLTTQFTNHPDQPGYSFTLWEDRGYGVPAFSHGGSMTGYATFLYLVPDHDLGIFVAYNQESGSLADRVVGTVVDALFPGRPPPAPRRPVADGIDPARFEGTYANSAYHHADPDTGWRRQPFEIRGDGEGGLEFQGASARPVGPLSFQRDDGLLLTFLVDDAGAISHLVVNQTVYEKLD
jgi:CubicO group peptidase (beta-lactamase class C family)/beta-lactamase regulating signal transducer with metallopeptidase domain